MKKCTKQCNIKNIILILFLGVILGTTLMIGAFLLPTAPMEKNLSESVDVFNKEGSYQNVIEGYKCTQLDNFTDAVMLNAAIYNGSESLIDRAMNVYHPSINNGGPVEVVKAYFNGEQTEPSAYTRYWHGYIVVLKPLLLFFNYSDIRILNMCVQVLLFAYLIMLMYKRGLARYTIATCIFTLFLCPIVLPLSLQYSTMFYITLIAMILILLKHEYFEKKSYNYVFMIFGMVTSYFDFLTYPLVSLAIPLTLLLVIRDDKSLKNNVIEVIKLSIMWSIGYVFMWAGKWLVASILLNKNIFKDAFSNIASRTSMEAIDYKISILEVLKLNIFMLKKPIYILVTVLVISLGLYGILKLRLKFKYILITSIPYLMIMCIPFAWFIVASNHSYIHYWFTFRELSICAFAGSSLVLKLTEKNRNII